MTTTVNLTVNGKKVSAEVESRTLLVQLLRENLRLTGTHVGCDTSQCGACVIHLDGRSMKACSVLAVQAQGAEVLTIEAPKPGGTRGASSAGIPFWESCAPSRAFVLPRGSGEPRDALGTRNARNHRQTMPRSLCAAAVGMQPRQLLGVPSWRPART